LTFLLVNPAIPFVSHVLKGKTQLSGEIKEKSTLAI